VGVHDGTLDVRRVSVVRERALHKTLLLAQARDAALVIVLENLLAKNGVRDLRLAHHKVGLEHPCLQRAACLAALTLERVEGEGSRLL
jgi:hypothetical protein